MLRNPVFCMNRKLTKPKLTLLLFYGIMKLTNSGNENLELIHGVTLISIHVYTRNVPETVVDPSIAITTDIVANEKIEENANFYFSEVGTYYLHAKYSFSVGDEYFLYAIEPIEITVVE